MKRSISCAAAGLAAALVLAAPAGAVEWTAGAPSSGDPFFPQMGNGGYDVRHYSLELDYDPGTQVLDGSTEITLAATQDLDQFNLDLRDWFGVSRVTVDGVPAAYFQEDGQELVVTPHPKLRAGRTYTVDVDYRGVPETVVDPDDSFEGWVKNADGAFVVNEPQGSPGWFPCNDDPNDKATYDFAIAVPAAFFPMMRAWYAENRNGNVTTEDFIALAERESGQQLDAFFDVWLYTPGKPTSW